MQKKSTHDEFTFVDVNLFMVAAAIYGLQLGGHGPVKCGLTSPITMGQIDRCKPRTDLG